METEEVDLGRLEQFEKVSIHTANSTYEFCMTNPAICAGALKGGVLGETFVSASLLCFAPEETGISKSLKLSTGARAILFISKNNEILRIVTSQIRKLAKVRENPTCTE